MSFDTAILNHAGGRATNQDAVRHAESGGCACWVIADGLGGYAGGAQAAAVACDAFLDGFVHFAECSPEAMHTYLGMANRAVRNAQASEGPDASLPAAERRGMRTTIAAVVADPHTFVAGHCGDSRIYHLRASAICFQTRDHSLVQAMVDAGDLSVRAAASHPDRNRLLRCLGEQDEANPEVTPAPLPLSAGDALLLATDGFCEYLFPQEIEAEHAKAGGPAPWLDGMAIRLRQRLAARMRLTPGATAPESDNYSAIGIFRNAPGESR